MLLIVYLIALIALGLFKKRFPGCYRQHLVSVEWGMAVELNLTDSVLVFDINSDKRERLSWQPEYPERQHPRDRQRLLAERQDVRAKIF